MGASNYRSKFGNRVLRHYLERHLKIYPINPNETKVEGLACLSSVNELPDEVISLSIITPPTVTEKIVEVAISKGIQNIQKGLSIFCWPYSLSRRRKQKKWLFSICKFQPSTNQAYGAMDREVSADFKRQMESQIIHPQTVCP